MARTRNKTIYEEILIQLREYEDLDVDFPSMDIFWAEIDSMLESADDYYSNRARAVDLKYDRKTGLPKRLNKDVAEKLYEGLKKGKGVKSVISRDIKMGIGLAIKLYIDKKRLDVYSKE